VAKQGGDHLRLPHLVLMVAFKKDIENFIDDIKKITIFLYGLL
jgi:hypothetical protein